MEVTVKGIQNITIVKSAIAKKPMNMLGTLRMRGSPIIRHITIRFPATGKELNPLRSKDNCCGQVNQSIKYILINMSTNNPSRYSMGFVSSVKPSLACLFGSQGKNHQLVQSGMD